MNDEYFKIIDLEKHETRNNQDQHVNGSLTVVWRDWDNIIKDEFKMIYVTSVNPGSVRDIPGQSFFHEGPDRNEKPLE